MLEWVVAAAPRIDPRLRRLARRLARGRSPIAQIHRNVGEYAERLGLVRPSYEQIRVTVNESRARAAVRRATAKLLVDVELGVRPVTDLLGLLEE